MCSWSVSAGRSRYITISPLVDDFNPLARIVHETSGYFPLCYALPVVRRLDEKTDDDHCFRALYTYRLEPGSHDDHEDHSANCRRQLRRWIDEILDSNRDH